jgi:phenylalanyl-tRNA synthetase beta chain
MLIERNALLERLPALRTLSLATVRDRLAFLGLPVDASQEHGDTWVMDVDITPNRGDAMSHHGIARDLAASLGAALDPIPVHALPEGLPLVPVRLEAEACSLYATALLELGGAEGTPEDARTFLAHMGSNAKFLAPVDASNELLHRYGHPTHAFDADLLKGGISVRWALAGETLVTLDEVARRLGPEDLVIADETGPIALAGVMGGRATRVSEATRRVLLESAYFDPRVVRAMARRHALHSDASHRFGRGADPAMARVARDLLVQRLVDWAGARLLGAWTVGAGPVPHGEIRLGRETLHRIAGEEIPLPEATSHLSHLGCRVSLSPDHLAVLPPTWRHDLDLEEDLAEEVLRLRSYEAIPSALPPLEGPPLPQGAPYLLRRNVATRLAHLGFHQTVTLGFISPEEDAPFALPANPPEGRTLGNPLGLEYSVLRASLLPSLRQAAASNLRQGVREVRLFELAPVFTSSPDGPLETATLGLVWAGGLGGEDPLSRPRPVQAADLIGLARDLGVAGEVAVQDLGNGILALEVGLDRLPPPGLRVIPPFKAFSRFPPMERDLSLLVPGALSHQTLTQAMASVLPGELRDIRCVDIFRGPGLPEGRQAWLMRLRFQADDRTLRGEEADAWVAAALSAAEGLGATRRV